MTACIFELTGSNNDKTHLIVVCLDVFIVQMKQSACVNARNGTSIKQHRRARGSWHSCIERDVLRKVMCVQFASTRDILPCNVHMFSIAACSCNVNVFQESMPPCNAHKDFILHIMIKTYLHDSQLMPPPLRLVWH